MREIAWLTCITFKPRTNEKDYVHFFYGGNGCNSNVGRTGGKQNINLAPGSGGELDCATTVDVVQHEVMHALGFYHEFTRPDRDDYVNIIFDNVKESM